jgi:hypothetical protein
MTKSEGVSSGVVSSFGFRHSSFIRISGFVILVCSLTFVGCTDSSDQSSVRDKQDQALKDPYGYKVDVPKQDISGGGTMDYDKEGMKKDVDHVFNP